MEKLTNSKNALLSHVKKLGKSRSYRYECGEFLCDGSKLLFEALDSGACITGVFAASDINLDLPADVKAYKINKSILEGISPLKNPQDVLFTCKIPEEPQTDLCTGTHILLDSVQDPGNIGTIIRSAFAFGIDSVILYGGCADPYNPKAIRASMGAIFKQRVIYTDINKLKKTNARYIGTVSETVKATIDNADLKNAVIIFGSEGHGISKDLEELCKEVITIPINKYCESLNVAIAASVIMYEAGKGSEQK